MIARSASGSFRDALGTLDQLVAFGGSNVELDDGAGDARRRRRRAALRGGRRGRRRGPEGGPARGREDGPLRPRPGSSSPATCSPTCASCWSPRRPARCPTSFVVTATDSARLQAQASRDRRRHPGPDDRRAGGGADRGARGGRRADGGRDRAAQGGAAGPGSVDRGIAAADRAVGEGSCGGGGPRVLSRGRRRVLQSCGRATPPRATRGRPRSADAAYGRAVAGARRRRSPSRPMQPGASRRPGQPAAGRSSESSREPLLLAGGRGARGRRRSRLEDDAGVRPRPAAAADALTSRRCSRSGPRSSTAAETAPALAATFEGARPVALDAEGAARSASRPTTTFNKRKAEAPEQRERGGGGASRR